MPNLACNSNWLDTDNTATPTITGVVIGGSANCTGSYQYQYPYWAYPISTYITTPARPIKLKMSEVDYLRNLAKDFPRLKETLKKFTDLIEITVDFD